MASSGFKDIARYFECVVCSGDLTKPKVLKCNHVFCASCLKQLSRNNTVTCPLCRCKHTLASSGVDGLPEPLLLQDIKEKVEEYISESNQEEGLLLQKCGPCGKNSTAEYCPVCAETLCKHCADGHRQDEMTRYHKLAALSQWTVCREHKEKLVTGYCLTCNMGLCILCKLEKHSVHDIISIKRKDLVEERKSKLEQMQTAALSPHPIYGDPNDIAARLASDLKKLKETASINKQRLKDFRNKLLNIISDLQEEMDNHVIAEEARINSYKAEIDDLIVTRESLSEVIEDVFERGYAPEIVMAADELPNISTVALQNAYPSITFPEIVETNNIVQDLFNVVVYKKKTAGTRKRVLQGTSATLPTKKALLHQGLKAPDAFRYSEDLKPTGKNWTSDVLWNKSRSCWLLRSMGNLHQFNEDNKEVDRFKHLQGDGHLCIDTSRNRIITTDTHIEYHWDMKGKTKNKYIRTTLMSLAELSWYKETVREIKIPDSNHLAGVTYCSQGDVYVVVDKGLHCLWFIDSQTEEVISRVGSEGSDNDEFSNPESICHLERGPGSCCLIVSDHGNKAIKLLSNQGVFIRYIARNSYPGNLCIDPWSRLVCCDNGTVVSYDIDDKIATKELISRYSLFGGFAECVAVSEKGIMVGIRSSRVFRFYKVDI